MPSTVKREKSARLQSETRALPDIQGNGRYPGKICTEKIAFFQFDMETTRGYNNRCSYTTGL
jgi:hypothetical protein